MGNDNWTLQKDLNFVLQASERIFSSLNGSRIFLTGGTGFIGCWLLESIRNANIKMGLEIEVTILTRNFNAFSKKAPHLVSHKSFSFFEGQVSDFSSPAGAYSHVIHAATDASADLNENNPTAMFNTIIDGTRRTLDFAFEKCVEKVLFLSSGAIYGQQPSSLERIAENWLGGPSPIDSRACYAEAKRGAEMLCAIYGKQYGLNISIARIFALLGPYLSLDIHFAAGNFINDAMSGRKIIVKGNGLPSRSYLYASDLTIWLLHILINARSNTAYNVGSDEPITIAELAKKTAGLLSNSSYKILGEGDKGWNLGRYVPDTRLIFNDFGLERTVSLENAILWTAMWNGWQGREIL